MDEWTVERDGAGWRAYNAWTGAQSGLYLTWDAAARAVGLAAPAAVPLAVAIADAVHARLGHAPAPVSIRVRTAAPKKGRR